MKSTKLFASILVASTLLGSAIAGADDRRIKLDSAAARSVRNDVPITLRPIARRGVHINSVRVTGNVGQPATFIVEIQNNLPMTARMGAVFVDSNSFGSPYQEFNNLAPGERRTLTLNTSLTITPNSSHLVGLIMEPDNASYGEVWDQVWHRVTYTGNGFNDLAFTR